MMTEDCFAGGGLPMSAGKSDVVAYMPTFVSEGHGRPELWKGMQPDPDGEWVPLSLLLDARAEVERLRNAQSEVYRSANQQHERAELAEALAGKNERDARRLRDLVADTDAFPCDYPCLRDDLADWIRDHDAAIDTVGGGWDK